MHFVQLGWLGWARSPYVVFTKLVEIKNGGRVVYFLEIKVGNFVYLKTTNLVIAFSLVLGSGH